MRCGKCKKHFMTHSHSYIATLPSEQQVRCELVSGKGNSSHISLLCLLRSGLPVAQVQRYVCGGQGLATLPPSQVKAHPTVGQGMLIINIILACQ